MGLNTIHSEVSEVVRFDLATTGYLGFGTPNVLTLRASGEQSIAGSTGRPVQELLHTHSAVGGMSCPRFAPMLRPIKYSVYRQP
jgi:hypothetical protein